MLNSTLSIRSTRDLQSDQVNFNAQSARGTCEAGQSVNIDLLLTDAHFITGCSLAVKGASFGDSTTVQVVHPQAGVLNQFVTEWGMVSDKEGQLTIELPYPAKLPAGLIVRLVYTADAVAGTRHMCNNYFLHKIILP